MDDMKEEPICTVNYSGAKEWRFDGKAHRIDGPAIIWLNGSKFWYVKGKCHRIDGPAVIWSDGSVQWWLNNNYYYSFNLWAKAVKLSPDNIVELKLVYG